jgi:hypothetical protein
MKRTGGLIVLLAVTTALVAGARSAAPGPADPEALIAHEWGTFTTVAGSDGRAMEWLPLAGADDLPCFVERYGNSAVKGLPGNLPALSYDSARKHLSGKVRMETPVIYFYSPGALRATIRVTFPRGVITEWYPRAVVRQPPVTAVALREPQRTSVLEWRAVGITPDLAHAFPREEDDSHYYAARATDAATVQVDGQREKFLFYRGVGGFDVPLAAVALDDGSVRVRNLETHELRGVILFENRDGRLTYRTHGSLRGEATIAAPGAPATLDVLRAELERILTEAGLYPREARAMVDTWRDSWFEEGTRVFYVLAPEIIDAILPLEIDPRPVETTRVFVGRMEVITPQVLEAVRRAIVRGDNAALGRHGRFLGAIANRLADDGIPLDEAERIRQETATAFAAYAGRPVRCR